MKILVINSGSSSIKYQMFDMNGELVLTSGIVERIGLEVGNISHKTFINGEEKKVVKEFPIPNHKVGLSEVVNLLTDAEIGVIQNPDEVSAVGHRVVHGGEYFNETTLITPEVEAKIEEVIPLAPLHNPANLEGIKVCTEIFSSAKQVAVFDTAFHQTMPAHAYRYAIPEELYKEHHVRSYGMHGTSHKYVSAKTLEYLNLPKEGSKIITVHLGNGCSMSAVKDGKCIDTSMGFSPLAGLMMGTRSGDIDPAVIFFLEEKLNMKTDEIYNLLNKKSGMLGLTGFSDMRDVEDKINAGDAQTRMARDLYTYRIKKYIGSYIAALNGVDAIVFTAGVGENDTAVREEVIEGLDFCGIKLNKEENSLRKPGIREIQAEDSNVKVLIVPTNEELEIARQAQDLIK
ncbi:acetate/propionate family kinase [Sediminitomix flava]|uniref:Acetate kinase n=1 Tax=Sediminitomix flava TaxID=379075 RepID=A0A315Z5K9_SEDFL|nr:acetate kinase [Sediminitomix flava]PWJ38426.1 acetate kinase [Sediminitomix flava]